MPTKRAADKKTRQWELRRGIGHHLTFLARLPGKRRAPSRAPKQRLEPKARQSHAHQASDPQKDKVVGVKERKWPPLDVFGSLARKTKGPSGAHTRGGSNRKPAKWVIGRKTSQRELRSRIGRHSTFASSLARQTKGPIKSAEGTARTQSPPKSCPPSERPTKRQGSGG